MEVIVKINCGLWLILNLAINDSRVPTTMAKRYLYGNKNGNRIIPFIAGSQKKIGNNCAIHGKFQICCIKDESQDRSRCYQVS